MFLITVFLVCIIAAITWYKRHFKRRDYLYSLIPHPKQLPIVHNSLEFIGKSNKEWFDWMEKTADELGPVYYFSTGIFGSGFVMTSDVRVVEALLSSQTQLDKTVDYNYLVPWVGTGLLISNGKKWFTRRKLLTPGFHFSILEKFVDIMSDQADIFVEILAKYDGSQVDIFLLTNLYALDTVCEAAMGINVHAQTKQSEYVNAVQEITKIITLKSFDTMKQIEFVYRFSEMHRREQKLIKLLHAFTDKIIQSRREELLSKQSHDDVEDDVGTKKKKALLDILLSSTVEGQPLSDLDIREEVDTFMFAGHDTTKSGISFVFYCIAMYPEVQEKVYEEVMHVLGESDDAVTVQKLNELRYLELVIKESLRLFPPVPFFGRQLSAELTVAGYTFPKGMNIYVSPYLMGKSSAIFSDPEKFDPHRFEVEMSHDKINAFSYVPFSAGPRNCIGQKFAQFEMRTIVAKVIRRFKLSVAEKVVISSEIVMKSENGVNLKIERRKQ